MENEMTYTRTTRQAYAGQVTEVTEIFELGETVTFYTPSYGGTKARYTYTIVGFTKAGLPLIKQSEFSEPIKVTKAKQHLLAKV